MNIIEKIDRYYRKQNKKINKTLDISKDYIIKFDKKNRNILHIYNNHKEKYMTVSYNFYGIIHEGKDYDTFIWANYIYGVNNPKIIQKIKEIRKNAKLFKNNNLKSKFYHKILKQEKTLINNNEQYQWLNKLLMYLNKDYYFLNPSNSHNNIQMIGLHRIKEKYF